MKKILLFAGLILSFGFSIHAQVTVNLGPNQDNSIYSESTNSNGQGRLYSGKTCSGDDRRALIQFDFSSIPTGATITNVSLDLNVDNVSGSVPGNADYNLHKLTTLWGEGMSNGGGSGATAISPDATWSEGVLGTTSWTTPGGDFIAIPSAITNLTTSLGGYAWTSAGMISDVQNWIASPLTNLGWILIGDETANCSARRFGSSEQGTAPVLSITYTCVTPPTATCQNPTVYINQSGLYVLQDADLNGGSVSNCGGNLIYNIINPTLSCANVTDISNLNSLIISAVYDGPLTLGTPKGIELYVINDITDLSIYGVGSANNGGGTDGEEFTFPAVSASAGTYIYISSESTQFQNWFGFSPDYTSGSMAINGDDAIELFQNGVVIDVFGDINIDGTGQTWEYLDGWASRNTNSVPNLGVQNDAEWTFSGINVLDGETDNASASTPVPVSMFVTPASAGINITFEVTDQSNSLTSTCVSVVTVLDTLPPTVSCVGATSFNLDATGNLTLTTGDIEDVSSDNCGGVTLALSQTAFTCNELGVNSVTLYATDQYGNVDSCTTNITITPLNTVSLNSIASVMTTCFGVCDGQLTITATNATGYSVDNGVTYQASNVFPGLCQGNYDVVVMSDAANCNQIASMTGVIDEPSEITTSFTVTDVDCFGNNNGSIDMTTSASSVTTTFDWDNDGTGDTDDLEDITGLSPAMYHVTITDGNSCVKIDSAEVHDGVDIDLTFSVTGATITSNYPFANYEWMNCSDNSIISGENDYEYTATENGSYAVIITSIGCVDTTDCTEITGLNLIEEIEFGISIYPNPSNGNIYIDLSNNVNGVTVSIIDINGKIVANKSTSTNKVSFDLSQVENGIYFVQISTSNSIITKKISITK